MCAKRTSNLYTLCYVGVLTWKVWWCGLSSQMVFWDVQKILKHLQDFFIIGPILSEMYDVLINIVKQNEEVCQMHLVNDAIDATVAFHC